MLEEYHDCSSCTSGRILAGYYVLRPLRDEMGIAGGVKALPWMFAATHMEL